MNVNFESFNLHFKCRKDFNSAINILDIVGLSDKSDVGFSDMIISFFSESSRDFFISVLKEENKSTNFEIV